MTNKDSKGATDPKVFSDITHKLESYIETLRQIGIIVADFQPDSQNVLFSKLNGLVDQMNDLDGVKNKVDVDIPMHIFDYVDKGLNPNLFTEDFLEQTLHMNQATKGKVDAYVDFREAIEDKIKDIIPPEELAEYKKTSLANVE
eukprot:Nk52_evm31s232 gene=Nk52_evmTU31s232